MQYLTATTLLMCALVAGVKGFTRPEEGNCMTNGYSYTICKSNRSSE